MDRNTAIQNISELIGHDICLLAKKYLVPIVAVNGKTNKGWAGHVIERHLGLALNSSRSPNFGSWELKVIPLIKRRDGTLKVKETMAITMIDPYEVVNNTFEDSHLFNKLNKMVVVSRTILDKTNTSSIIHSVSSFDLDDEILYRIIKEDYDLIRNTIKNFGFESLTGRQGKLIQPRTKGAGHGSTSRAFYARTELVAHIINLQRCKYLPPVEP